MDEEQDLEKTQEGEPTTNREERVFPIEEYKSRNTREREGRMGVFRQSAQGTNPNSPLAQRNATLKLKRNAQFKRAQELGGGVPLDNTLNLSEGRGVGESLNRENLRASTSSAQSEASRRNALPSRMQNYKPLENEVGSQKRSAQPTKQKENKEKQGTSNTNNPQTNVGGGRGLGQSGQGQATQNIPADKFPFGTVFLMVGTAIFFDTLQIILDFIPFVGWILSPLVSLIASFTFFLWFKMKGVKFDKFKNAAALGGSFIFELVPILNALPAQTGAVLWIIGREKAKKFIPLAEKVDSLSKKVA